MRIFKNIPKKISFSYYFCIIIWALADGYFTTLLSTSVANNIHDKSGLIKASLFVLLFVVLWEVEEYVSDILLRVGSTHIENNGFLNYFEKLYTTDPETLKKANTGYISGLLSKTISKEERAYSEFVVGMLLGVTFSVYVMCYCLKFSWIFSLIIFLSICLGVSVRLIAIVVTKKRLERLNHAEAERVKLFMDATTNISTVQKLRSITFLKKKMNEENDKCLKLTYRWAVLDEVFFTLYKVIMFAVAPMCFLVLSSMKEINFNAEVFITYICMIELQLVHTSKHIAGAIKSIGIWKVSQKQLNNITKNQNKKYVNGTISSDFEKIEIRNAKYSYKNENTNNSITVNIPHLEISKGDKVCISGESGQGKTTTLNILSGTINTSNVLFVNDKPLESNIGAVFIAQDVEMLDMTLRDNLAMGKDIEDEDLEKMIDLVGLTEWYEKQPKKLDTILGERGVFVSTGQRQRLNLIRGILEKDKEIYLLDEPTSNVDDETEQKMINLIKNELKDKTVVIVTHREAIKNICNKHYIFKNGICEKNE